MIFYIRALESRIDVLPLLLSYAPLYLIKATRTHQAIGWFMR